MGRAGHFELVGHVRTHGAQFLAVHKYAAVVVDRVEMHKRALAPLQPRQHELPLQVVIPERAQRRGYGDRIVECAVNVPLPRAVERHARAGTRSIGNSRRGGKLGRSKHRLPEAITRAPEARHGVRRIEIDFRYRQVARALRVPFRDRDQHRAALDCAAHVVNAEQHRIDAALETGGTHLTAEIALPLEAPPLSEISNPAVPNDVVLSYGAVPVRVV